MIILFACFGIDSLIEMSSVSFPASVACLILLFLGLILCDVVVGDRKTRAVVKVIDIPVRTCLSNIHIWDLMSEIFRLDLHSDILTYFSLLRKLSPTSPATWL